MYCYNLRNFESHFIDDTEILLRDVLETREKDAVGKSTCTCRGPEPGSSDHVRKPSACVTPAPGFLMPSSELHGYRPLYLTSTYLTQTCTQTHKSFFNLKKCIRRILELGLVAHVYESNTWQVEALELGIQDHPGYVCQGRGQPGLRTKAVFQNKIKKERNQKRCFKVKRLHSQTYKITY